MDIEKKAGYAPRKPSDLDEDFGPRGKHGFGTRRGDDVPLGVTAATGKFGRLFPSLTPLTPSRASLERLGRAMMDIGQPGAPEGATGTESGNNPLIPAGFTYLGQFVDHDLTFDPTALQEVLEDPQALENFRTPKLDLDSVYGSGPVVNPFLYDRNDGDKFLIGLTSATPGQGDGTIPVSMPNDLPRAPHGFALVGDPRNDENLAVAQTHLAFLKFHNKIVDGLRDGSIPRRSPLRKGLFDEARDLTIWHYQRIVFDDFLARICRRDVLEAVKQSGGTLMTSPFMPVEFSAAAYRFGHSLVRENYDYNRVFREGGPAVVASLGLLFTFSGLSGRGNTVPIPSDWIIDWRRFYDLGEIAPNPTRLIDPLLAPTLQNVPGVQNEPSLAVRNLRRGRQLGLPPGQSIARLLGIDPLRSDEFTGPDGAIAIEERFDIETPLWYYILKEAQMREGGHRLGELGSRIVAEVFVTLLVSDPGSFMARKGAWDWESDVFADRPGEFTMANLLRFVDDVNPIGE